MKDYKNFDRHLNKLAGDIYEQVPDAGHSEWAKTAAARLATIPDNIHSVLDVGCGIGFMEPFFRDALEMSWTGVTLGEDYVKAKEAGVANIHKCDMTFLPFENDSFDLIFARHVLEHSPFPLLSLMEWRRVCKNGFLLLVMPSPEYWGWKGKNHYSVMEREQIEWLLARSGWDIIHHFVMDTRDESFLQYMKGNWREWAEEPEEIRPSKDVEYQLLCQMVDEITE